MKLQRLFFFLLFSIALISCGKKEESKPLEPPPVATTVESTKIPVTPEEQVDSADPVDVKFALICRARNSVSMDGVVQVYRIVSLGNIASLTENWNDPEQYQEAILVITSESDERYEYSMLPLFNFSFDGSADINRQDLSLHVHYRWEVRDIDKFFSCSQISDKQQALVDLKKQRQAYRDYKKSKEDHGAREEQLRQESLRKNQKI